MIPRAVVVARHPLRPGAQRGARECEIPAPRIVRAAMARPPDWIEPMLATLTDERDLGDGWVLERKLDGIRCLAFARRGRVELLSRTRKPLAFPAVAAAVEEMDDDVILDGEVVAVDERG